MRNMCTFVATKPAKLERPLSILCSPHTDWDAFTLNEMRVLVFMRVHNIVERLNGTKNSNNTNNNSNNERHRKWCRKAQNWPNPIRLKYLFLTNFQLINHIMFDIFCRCSFAIIRFLSIVEIAHVYKALDIGHSSYLSHRLSVVRRTIHCHYLKQPQK